jgi:hypothetical protein
MRPSTPRKLALLSATALVVSAGIAHAETSPYYIGVTQGFGYDSNVFRQESDLEQASAWGSSGVVAGFDQPYGRQRFYGSGNVQYNYYNQLSQLDNTSYGLTGGWDWETIERLSGTLTASFNQNLGNYGGANDTGITTKNIQNSTLVLGTANYGEISLLVIHGALGYSSVRFTAPQYAFRVLDQSTATLGVRKLISGQLRLGTGFTFTDGDYTDIDETFKRYDLFVNGAWELTGLSTVNARLNYTWRTDTNAFGAETDDSGLTGWISWNYKPTGKLTFDTYLSYDTLANGVFGDLGGGVEGYVGDSNRLTTTLRLTGNYQATSKIAVNTSLAFYVQDNVEFDSSNSSDRVFNALLGATWTPTRNWQVACNINWNSRDSTGTGGRTPYDAYGAFCSAQFALQ